MVHSRHQRHGTRKGSAQWEHRENTKIWPKLWDSSWIRSLSICMKIKHSPASPAKTYISHSPFWQLSPKGSETPIKSKSQGKKKKSFSREKFYLHLPEPHNLTFRWLSPEKMFLPAASQVLLSWAHKTSNLEEKARQLISDGKKKNQFQWHG